jgi:predicted Fe-Mo cluster-binding NifX family protein
VPSTGEDLLSPVDNNFIRCSYFVIVDSDRLKVIKTVLNIAQCAARGAEIQVAQLLIDHQVEIVISPVIDLKSYIILQKAGIKIYLGINGSIKENIESLHQKKLVELKIATEYPIVNGLYIVSKYVE